MRYSQSWLVVRRDSVSHEKNGDPAGAASHRTAKRSYELIC